MFSDSSAARGFTGRTVLGWYLGVQERSREGHVKILLIRDKNNPAGLFTKAVTGTYGRQRLAVNLTVGRRSEYHCRWVFEDGGDT